MHRCRLLALGLFAVALLAPSVPATAGPPVPVHGNMVAVNLPDPGEAPYFANNQEFVGIDGSATGTGSPLGDFTAQLDFDLGFTAVPGVSPPLYAIPDDFFGSITFTDANGNLLYSYVIGRYDSPGSSTFSALIVFTGGTRRFQNATGTAFLQGADVPNTGGAVFTAVFNGSIRY